ncbi:hypothetical protein ACFLQW_03850 [Candidatus Zixiibacteriota bacterium]
MNIYFFIAALLIYAIAFVHSILGEWLILIPLFRMDLPRLRGSEAATRRVLRFAWHLTTVVLGGLATVVAIWSTVELDELIVNMSEVAAVTFLVSAAISLVLTRARHFSWYIFLIIGVLTWLGGH